MKVSNPIDRYIFFYNHKRFQSKLNNPTPAEFGIRLPKILYISAFHLTGPSPFDIFGIF